MSYGIPPFWPMRQGARVSRWRIVLWWLCGVFTNHVDRNTAQDDAHWAYCLRCGRIFGNKWKSFKTHSN
jgi:hypothetical protein